jgi:hypothetical protein
LGADVGDEEELEAKPYEMWWWDCPVCGEVNDCGDIEPSGTDECTGCGAHVEMKK